MNHAYRCDYCGGFTDPYVRECVQEGERIDPNRVTSKARDCRRKVCIVNRRSRTAKTADKQRRDT